MDIAEQASKLRSLLADYRQRATSPPTELNQTDQRFYESLNHILDFLEFPRTIVEYLIWEVREHQKQRISDAIPPFHKIAALLTQLTFQMPDTKTYVGYEDLVRIYSGLIRNVAYKADKLCANSLRVVVRPLAEASIPVRPPPTSPVHSQSSNGSSVPQEIKMLSTVYEALWNIVTVNHACSADMCEVEAFLDFLVEAIVRDDHPLLVQPAVGLSTFLIGPIFNYPGGVLPVRYLHALVALLANQSSSRHRVCSAALEALVGCIRQKHSRQTIDAFRTTRFKFDLQHLLQQKESTEQMKWNASKRTRPPTRTQRSTARKCPMGMNAMYPGGFEHSPAFTDAAMKSPFYGGVRPSYSGSSKNSDGLKSSSGYSEATTCDGSLLRAQPNGRPGGFAVQPAHFNPSQVGRQAHIRPLNTHQLSNTPSTDQSCPYASNDDYGPPSLRSPLSRCPRRTPTAPAAVLSRYSASRHTNEPSEARGQPNFRSYSPSESMRANSRSPGMSMFSTTTVNTFETRESSPRSDSYSPVNESELSESDSASQRGIKMNPNELSAYFAHLTTTGTGTSVGSDQGRTRTLVNGNVPQLRLPQMPPAVLVPGLRSTVDRRPERTEQPNDGENSVLNTQNESFPTAKRR
ncbi:hypothetical protein M3Y99_00022500 [Aphelenchoides fujianensis]|nr:hypothetical protein M3Y99_00022500 [Aphelenchoides fujianensis]